MILPLSLSLLAIALSSSASPTLSRRVVQKLDQAAFAEAQQRDETATRAFADIAIKTSGEKCLSIDQLSGDFRANLTPVQVASCNSTAGQKWDVITSGKHINQPGAMLVVSTLTQACLNFDPRRKAGDQVNLFSCGGRADGGGEQTDSQIFAFTGGAGPLAFELLNTKGTCLAVAGNALDQAACSGRGDATQAFTFG